MRAAPLLLQSAIDKIGRGPRDFETARGPYAANVVGKMAPPGIQKRIDEISGMVLTNFKLISTEQPQTVAFVGCYGCAQSRRSVEHFPHEVRTEVVLRMGTLFFHLNRYFK